jgi:hypothetical protein
MRITLATGQCRSLRYVPGRLRLNHSRFERRISNTRRESLRQRSLAFPERKSARLTDATVGHRHGSRTRSLTGTFGPIEIAVTIEAPPSKALSVRAYQAKLLEMAQANMTFAFEFSRRLATIRSPVEFPIVFAEFTSKRIAMFAKYTKEMAELSTMRPA